jgi:hypothetical protein
MKSNQMLIIRGGIWGGWVRIVMGPLLPLCIPAAFVAYLHSHLDRVQFLEGN